MLNWFLTHSCHPERSRGTCFRPELKSVAIDSWLWDSGRTSEDARAYIGEWVNDQRLEVAAG
jgi:hypothetical protein